MLTDTVPQLDAEIYRFYNKHLREKCESLRTSVAVRSAINSLEMSFENDFIFKTNRLNEKILLAILSWYMPDEIKYLINLKLREIWGKDLQEVREVLLTSKELALGWLLVQNRWGNKDFFGNILKLYQIASFVRTVKLKDKNKSKVKYKQFKRGYDDKGSLRPPHKSPRYDYREVYFYKKIVEDISLDTRVDSLIHEIYKKLSSA